MSAFKTVKFMRWTAKFEHLNLTTAFAEFFKFGSLNLKPIAANSALQKVKFDA